MLNKTFCLLLLSLIPIFGFSQANSQYPDSGNKIRLGFQTSGDGLIWRDTQPKSGGYQPINNKAAWIILDTINNKFYHYKNSTWTLAGGQDIDTANLIATKYNLGFKLSLADTGNMLTPYWRSGRFSGVLPVLNGGTNLTTFTAANRIPYASSATALTTTNKFTFDSNGNKLIIGKNDSLDSNPNYTINLSGSDTPAPALGFRLYNTTLNKVSIFRYDNNHSFVFANNDADNGLGAHRFRIGSGSGEEILTITRPTPSGTDGRVGIGTASPSEKLHVVGNGLFTSAVTATKLNVTDSIQSNSGIYKINSSTLGLNVDNTTPFRITTGGNWGIYNDNPQNLLSTFSSSARGGLISNSYPILMFNEVGNSKFVFGLDANEGYLWGFANVKLIMATNNTEKMRIETNGNVGIGQPTPTARLQVKGSGISTGEAFKIENSIGTNLLTVLDNGSMTLNTPLSVANGGTGSATQNFVDLTTAQTVGGQKTFTSTLNLTNEDGLNINNTNGKIVGGGTTAGRFFFNNTDLTSYFVIYGSAHPTNPHDIVFVTNTNKIFQFNNDGNFGIGTTSPVANLQINSSTTSPATMAFSQSVSNTSAQRGQFAFYNSNISTVASIIAQAVTDNVGTDLEFYTRPVGGLLTKNMVILNNGNVGIGTGSPLSPLSVNASNAKLATGFWHVTLFDNTPMNTGVGGGFTFGGLKSATANEVFAAIDSYKENATSNNAAGAMRFHTQPSDGSGVVERMRISSTGNVGIGTANTWAKLVVNNGTNLNLAIKLGQSDPTAMMLNAHNDAVNANIPMEFRATKFNFELGNVGIGTTSPNIGGVNRALTLNAATSTNASYELSVNNILQGSLYTTISDASVRLANFNSGDLVFLTGAGGIERMRISSTGAVTINNLGTGTLYTNAGTLTNTNPSDSTLKNSINSYTYGLSEILQLKPKTFYYNSDVTRSYLKYGFIAQDVQSIMPDLVRIINNGNDKLGLESEGIYVAMVNAIQQLSAEIDILKQEIINLKNK